VNRSKLSGGDEPIRTGRRLGERKSAGKIYPVDPEAAARLKAYVCEKQKLEPSASKPEKGDILSNILRTQHERQAELNARKRKPEIAAELAHELHITYYQAGYSVKEVAEHAGVGRNRLARRWKELGLPVSRRVEERTWHAGDKNQE
jgi:DNA-binding NtrC family response regulator